MSEKVRLDVFLVEKGMVRSRPRAQELIRSGACTVDGVLVKKPGTFVSEINSVVLDRDEIPYVSRGGLKLKKAIDTFGINLKDRVCLDIGASTGGFTDCMLQEGAAFVYAIDSGHDQLDAKLRKEPAVCSMEGFNVKELRPESLPAISGKKAPDFAAMDVSFISVTKLLIPVCETLSEGAELVCLIKPQFEAGPSAVGKKGIVRDRNVHMDVLLKTYQFIQTLPDPIRPEFLSATYSPVLGGDGNIEFLFYLKKGASPIRSIEVFDRVVDEAHRFAGN